MRCFSGCLLSISLALCGCSHIRTALPSGSNTVSGRASLTAGGYSRPCEEVILVSATPSLARRVESFLSNSRDGFTGAITMDPIDSDPDFERLSRTSECRDDGRFSFAGVADGRYYLIAQVTGLLKLSHRGGFIVRAIDLPSTANPVDMSVSRDKIR
jgi:hypothetical protein